MPAPRRPNAHQANPELFARYKTMSNDPGARNLMGQKALHAAMCDESTDCATGKPVPNVHHAPDFVLWHRAFLYYHEQILSALGAGDIGLPYWDWSVDRLCPAAFQASNFNFAGHLMHSTNGLGDENFTADHILAVVASLRSMPPETAAAELFDEPIHKLVHSRFGWDRRNDLMTAAGDPAFYGHHANLDRLANQIFVNGWPAPSGISYRFIGVDNKPICTKLDQFATMPSPYEDSHLDTSAFAVNHAEELSFSPGVSYSRVRTRLRFPHPLPMGNHRLTSRTGAPLGEIASLHHRGETEFIVWLSARDYQEARANGVQVVSQRMHAAITRAHAVIRK